jgi:thimet oligopeptidase
MTLNHFAAVCSFIVLAACTKPTESPVTYYQVPGNPIFNEFNKPIDFKSLKPVHFRQATDSIIAHSNRKLQNLISGDAGDRTFDNTMLALDDLYDGITRIGSIAHLMQSTHTDSLMRVEALQCATDLEKYENELSLNEDLYKAVKAYAESGDAASMKERYKKRFLDDVVKSFERNGFALPKEKRDSLKMVKDAITETGNEFDKNIAAYQDHLVVYEKDAVGLPEDYKKARRQPDGTYKIDLSYPSFQPFMKYAVSDKARYDLYVKYMNRAADKNMDVLLTLLQQRQHMADLLGFKTYADWRLADRMAKDPETVWKFENELTAIVRPKADADYQELMSMPVSRSIVKEGMIQWWQMSYINTKLLEEKYQVDDEAIKEYFPMDASLDGLFKITQSLFGVTYREVKDAAVWHEEVRAFEVLDGEKLIGRFYLDFFPRPNKYTHAACFGMIKGRSTPMGYQLPMATLVCNFPPPSADKPSLLPHSQVRTLFHEFGHVLHQMLTTAALSSQSGTSVARDFVEAPSQIFENWIWNYDALSLFAKHYDTGEVLPRELFDKMIAARNVGSGLAAEAQIFYGMLDMTLHNVYDPSGGQSIDAAVKELTTSATHFPYVEGTHFPAAFGHLNGYGASYYGYMWSKVYAEDMFSIFEKDGLLNESVGRRYRDIILGKGDSDDPMNLVREFLGREPNNEAFKKSLGL